MNFRTTAVPILLCLVAAGHFVRHHTLQQSSWGAGCGFGMFATVDYHGSRFLRASLRSGEIMEPAGFRSRFPELDLKTTVLPTPSNLKTYATALLNSEWSLRESPPLLPVVVNGEQYRVNRYFRLHKDTDDGTAPPIRIDSVQLEVWGIRLELAQRRISAFPIRRVEVTGT